MQSRRRHVFRRVRRPRRVRCACDAGSRCIHSIFYIYLRLLPAESAAPVTQTPDTIAGQQRRRVRTSSLRPHTHARSLWPDTLVALRRRLNSDPCYYRRSQVSSVCGLQTAGSATKKQHKNTCQLCAPETTHYEHRRCRGYLELLWDGRRRVGGKGQDGRGSWGEGAGAAGARNEDADWEGVGREVCGDAAGGVCVWWGGGREDAWELPCAPHPILRCQDLYYPLYFCTSKASKLSTCHAPHSAAQAY
jgi:hypothetical protein